MQRRAHIAEPAAQQGCHRGADDDERGAPGIEQCIEVHAQASFMKRRTEACARTLARGGNLPGSGKVLPVPHVLQGRCTGRMAPKRRLGVLGMLLAQQCRTSCAIVTEARVSEGLFGIHGAALELRGQRLGMLTSNIANAATPGYKARDLDFGAALEARLGGAGNEAATAAATRYRVPTMPSLDGNTVELGNEQMAFAENAVAYSADVVFHPGPGRDAHPRDQGRMT